MPRIRKKTSKRTNIHQRARIKHKAAETRKKRGKEAKKVTQWKSKHPKDPGIPANFPYKDQILAEITEQRRQATEEKEKRKEEKRAAKAKAAASGDSHKNNTIIEGSEKPNAEGTVVDVSNEDDVPTFLNPDYLNLKEILDRSDVVIHVLDVRDPLAFRSSHLEELATKNSERKILFVLNKIDTCPCEAVIAWATYLRTQYPTFIFRSASSFLPGDLQPHSKGKEKERADDAFGVSSILGYLSQRAENKTTGGPLMVAVTGVTNVGKSSLINSVLRKAACPIYKLSSFSQTPTTTAVPQQFSLEFSGKTIHLIDTPGLSWESPRNVEENYAKSIRAQDILLRSRGHLDRLKDPMPTLNHIVSRAKKQDLMLFYNLPAFADNDPVAFLSGVARSNSLIKTGGDPDLNAAARIVLRDWSTGKFPRYTMPPSTGPGVITAIIDDTTSQLYIKDEAVLSQLKSRKDMRKSKGIAKLSTGVVDTRKIILDADWTGTADSDAEDDEEIMSNPFVQNADIPSEDDDGNDDDDDGDDDDDEGEEDGEEEDGGEAEEKAEVPPVHAGKRKRPSKTSKPMVRPPRPTKKVVFSSQPHPTSRISTAAPLKSALKNGTAASVSKMAGGAPKEAKTGVHHAKNGEHAYDFGKFF